MSIEQLFGLIEVVGVFALVMGFGFWELNRINRRLRRDDDESSS
jgi:hypothetical protein